MLGHLAALVARPATAEACAAAASSRWALGAVAACRGALAYAPADASALLRDGGRDASTSYAPGMAAAPSPLSHPALTFVRRHSTSSPAAAAAAAAAAGAGTGRAARAPAAAASSSSSSSSSSPPSSATTSTPSTASNALAAPPSSSPAAAAAAAAAAAVDGLDMEQLLSVLLHPLPLGRVRNPALLAADPGAVLVGGGGAQAMYFDPQRALTSAMRALHVVRAVLRNDGHVLIVNPNPAMRPLLRDAAHMCVNSNVLWWYDDWSPGALTNRNGRIAASDQRQPTRRMLAARGIAMRNALSIATHGPRAALRADAPALPAADVQRLLAGMRGAGLPQALREHARAREAAKARHAAALAGLAAARSREARLLLPNTGPPAGVGARRSGGSSGARSCEVALVVALDLSYGGEAVREAYERNVPCVALLNGHSDASRVTYPVYASEAHAGFQHWFLDWLLRLVNLPYRRPAAAAAAAAAS